MFVGNLLYDVSNASISSEHLLRLGKLAGIHDKLSRAEPGVTTGFQAGLLEAGSR